MNRAEQKILILSAALALATFGLAAVFHQVTRNDWPGGWTSLWRQWDTLHYLTIAESGYTSSGENAKVVVFFPLYPWLVRALSAVTGDALAAGLLLSSATGALSAVLLFRLARLDRPERVASRASAALLLFPTAYFLRAAYSESLFLALTLASFLAARHGRWATASVAGFLAVLTRMVGLALLPGLLVEFWIQRGAGRAGPRLRELAWLALIPAGLLVYLGINARLHGSPFQFLEFQRVHWHKEAGSALKGLETAWRLATRGGPEQSVMSGGFEIAAAALGWAAALATPFRLRASYGAYAIANLAMITTTSFWQSTPRYLLAVFPIFILIADASREPLRRSVLVFVALTLQAFLMSRFVSGAWAF